jgi:uncharacterized protein
VAVQILIEKNVRVPMRDGVMLATDVFRPAGDGRHPVLVQRLPYNKEPAWLRNASVDVLRLAQAGYVVLHQDTRGAGASEGSFRPFLDDRLDGYDTVEWAAGQPWSTGDVGMFGISYTAGTQWLAAIETPPSLKAIAPHSFHHDPYHGFLYRGGAFALGVAIRWCLQSFSPGQREAGTVDRFEELIWRRPLTDLPLMRDIAPFYFEWLAHPSYDDYWRQWSPLEHFDNVTTPALITTGWYDALVGGCLTGYTEMRKRGAGEQARSPRLIVGPWAHTWWGSDFPERSFGERGDKDVFDLTGCTVHWFDHHLKRVDNGFTSEKPVRIFVMGPNIWREEDDWPLPDTQFTKFFLHSDGRANTAGGDGVLSTDPPGDEHGDVYLYDPRSPVPTIGGQTLLPPARMPKTQGPMDQRALSGRTDVLTYVTPPLERELEVTGPVELVLFVSSSARDTDFTGKLIDVHPDGRAEILTDGILRARYRDSFSDPQLLEPDRTYELRLDLMATGNVFAPGHRIRLDVSSSNFPHFDRNTNTGNVIAEDRDEDVQVAVNRVFHDQARPSHLVLPIIRRGGS